MSRTEDQDEQYLIAEVKRTGGWTRKVKWAGRRGAPDRLCGWPNGRHAYPELKHPDQGWGLQPHQEREHKRMRAAGMDVRVLEGRDEIDTFIAEMTR